MILQERQPALGRVAATPNASQIPSDASFRDDEAEFLKFSVDLWGSPVRVLFRQASDQNTNLIGDLRSAAAWPGSPTPVETEIGAVPADDGLGLHDDEDVGPAGPKSVGGSSRGGGSADFIGLGSCCCFSAPLFCGPFDAILIFCSLPFG